MSYKNLASAIEDLEKHNMLVRVKEEVDPNLEMAAIHLHIFRKKGPALLFEKVKGTRYRALSNLFGDIERSRFLFRNTMKRVTELVETRNNPLAALRSPVKLLNNGLSALRALPRKGGSLGEFEEISITDLPLIKHWPEDGGAFVTLPQVYTEDIDKPGVMRSNLGMYRIQLTGNDYVLNREIGLHYQLHRGIGVHQTKTNKKGLPLKVSVFVGGPPSHTLAAVMPLPEGFSELTFAGVLGNRRFRYTYDKEGYCISLDADFVITGDVYPGENKPEGPFGDHLGYYSLRHDFPLMRVRRVLAKKNAIWPFTVVGRPPQEDTAFGALIHEISGSAIPSEIPGVKEVHAVDAAGVHPLLLAVGSERYTPYLQNQRPSELITQACRILGTGQLSLAKYLIISGDQSGNLNCHDIRRFLVHVFERIDLSRDLHFITRTSIDTLDYSGEGLNEGSKLIMAAYGEKKRELSSELPSVLQKQAWYKAGWCPVPGVLMLRFAKYINAGETRIQLQELASKLKALTEHLSGIVQVVLIDEEAKVEDSNIFNDYLWMTYTRSNPSHDIYGVDDFTENKHWGCRGAMIIDARQKPHHAPELQILPETERAIERFFVKGASLEKWK